MKNKLVTLLFAMTLIFSAPAIADSEVCRMANGFLDNGIGGTGQVAAANGDEAGIGGTGHAPTGGDEGKGIGGTGHDSGDGIGGTGKRHDSQKAEVIYVSGTIYAYGSLCINGIRVTYTDTTPVSDGASKTNASQLQLGQVVQVLAEKHRGETSVRAQSIQVMHMLEGPVTHIDKARNIMTVMGEPVRIAGPMPFKAGDAVRVSGLRNLAGDIVATHVAPKAAAMPDVLRGALHVNPQGMFVGQTKVSGIAPQMAGQEIVVKGSWNGAVLNASKAMPVMEKIPPQAAYVSIETYAGAKQAVAGRAVTGVTLLQGRVIVAGVPAPDGGIAATKVQDVPKTNTRTRVDSSGHGGEGRGSHTDDEKPAAPQSGGSDKEKRDGRETEGGETKVEKTESADKTEKTETVEKTEKNDKVEKTETVEKVEAVEKADGVERIEKIETIEKIEKIDGVEKVERVEKVETIEKVEKVDKVDKVEKIEKVEKVEKIEKPEKVEKIEVEKPEKIEKPED